MASCSFIIGDVLWNSATFVLDIDKCFMHIDTLLMQVAGHFVTGCCNMLSLAKRNGCCNVAVCHEMAPAADLC